MMNYYQFLGVSETATPAEIETALFTMFNEVRRLVTHHDPNVVNKANQDLLTIEKARSTLLDIQQRSAYDATLGLKGAAGGLADPQAILQKFDLGIGGAAPSRMRTAGNQQAAAAAVVPANTWVCGRCQSPHPIGTRFCKQCGYEISTSCPSCNNLVEATATYCQVCGVNVPEVRAQAEAEAHMREIEQTNQQRQELERLAVIGPLANISTQAWNLTRWGCITAFIFPIVSLPLWLLGAYRSRKALAYSQVPGDTEYRQLARKAFTWSVIPAGIVIVAIVLTLVLSILSAIMGANY